MLEANQIRCEVKVHEGIFEVWVERRSQLDQANSLMTRFLADPSADEFKVRVVDTERKKTQKLKAAYRKNFFSSKSFPYFFPCFDTN